MQRWGRLSFETGASHPPQDEAEYAQNLFLTLRRPRKRPSRRARPRRCNCVHSAMLAPMRLRGDDGEDIRRGGLYRLRASRGTFMHLAFRIAADVLTPLPAAPAPAHAQAYPTHTNRQVDR